MKAHTTSTLKIKLNDDDAMNFISVMRKISGSNKTIGFNKESLNEGEEHLVKKLSNLLDGSNPPQNQKGTVRDLPK